MEVIGGEGPDHLVGTDRRDLVAGGGGNDTLEGRRGDDSLFGGDGDDLLYGGDGADIFREQNGADTMFGGAGDDVFDLFCEGVTVSAGDGNDEVYSRSYDVSLNGGTGADIIDAGFTYNAVLEGGIGNDQLSLSYSTYGDVEIVIDGGEGRDHFELIINGPHLELNISGLTSGEAIDPDTNLTLRSLERGKLFYDTSVAEIHIGNASIDVMAYNQYSRADVLIGGRASTLFDGGEGNDLIQAGGGDDTIIGSYGDDTIEGGKGRDMAYMVAKDSTQVDLNITGSQFTGAGFDTFLDVEDVRGFHHKDRLLGNEKGNRLEDGDTDYWESSDTLIGNGGSDTLTAHLGSAADSLVGGAGSDWFIFVAADWSDWAPDFLMDLEAEDWVDISAIDANIRTDGDQVFTLVQKFSGNAGEARLKYDNSRDVTLLILDNDPFNDANLVVEMRGRHLELDNLVL
jgi:Ca2+-binding RTX toxin-like protein